MEGGPVQPEDFGIGRLFRYMRDGVIVANARTERIVLWNQCAGEIFGYSEAEALEMPLHTLVADHLVERHRTGIDRYQRTGEGDLIRSSQAVELPARHKDGREITIELSLTPIEDRPVEEGRYVLAIIRDATDRKTAERYAAQLEQFRQRQHQALELNDSIVQNLTVAKMALEMSESDKAEEVIDRTLTRARAIVTELLEDLEEGTGLAPGELVRRVEEPRPDQPS